MVATSPTETVRSSSATMHMSMVTRPPAARASSELDQRGSGSARLVRARHPVGVADAERRDGASRGAFQVAS
jgi:hypothetical protein